MWRKNQLPPCYFGEPTLVYTRYVYPIGRPSTVALNSLARLTPWNIYAPYGDDAPNNYSPQSANRHPIGARTPPSSNGSAFPWFGDVTVTNQHRGVGPVNGFDYYPQHGVPTFTLRLQYVYPNGIRSLRFGQIVFLNVPQYVNLDDETNHQGIAPSTQWGANAIGYPPVQPSLHRPVYPIGYSATLWGTHRVELHFLGNGEADPASAAYQFTIARQTQALHLRVEAPETASNGEVVTLAGSLKTEGGKGVAGAGISVRDAGGDVDESYTLTNSNGYFETFYTIPEAQPDGEFALTLSFRGTDSLKAASTTVRMEIEFTDVAPEPTDPAEESPSPSPEPTEDASPSPSPASPLPSPSEIGRAHV